jgi:DNA-binding NtrC family response regulator
MEELRRILGHSRWTLREAATLSTARILLDEQPGVVLICEAVLPDGDWKELLEHTLRLPLPPPLIVVARQADDYLWIEVLNSGGYNLLAIPLEEREVFRLVSMAWLHLRDNRAQRAHSSPAFRPAGT